jgi:hypothetical protein
MRLGLSVCRAQEYMGVRERLRHPRFRHLLWLAAAEAVALLRPLLPLSEAAVAARLDRRAAARAAAADARLEVLLRAGWGGVGDVLSVSLFPTSEPYPFLPLP